MRIGLVGCGTWGRLILRDLLAEGAEVAVADPDPAARAAAASAGASGTCADPRDLPEADGYVVASPTSLHPSSIDALLPRGRPLFVEKPLTADPAEAERLCAEAGDRIFCMEKWRYHGGVLKLAELARSGVLGEVRHLKCWRMGWGHRHPDVDAAWQFLPHDLSIAREILGPLPPLDHARATPMAGGDLCLTAILAGSGGPAVEIEVSTRHPVPLRAVLVTGSAGSAHLADGYADHVTLGRADGTREAIAIPTDLPLVAELRAFLAHLAGGPAPKSSAAEAAETVRRIAEIRARAGLA